MGGAEQATRYIDVITAECVAASVPTSGPVFDSVLRNVGCQVRAAIAREGGKPSFPFDFATTIEPEKVIGLRVIVQEALGVASTLLDGDEEGL